MKTDTISIKKVFNAAVDKVWDAWTNPAQVRKWFGADSNGIVLHAELDVVPGGQYSITFRDSNGTEHTCYGVYEFVELHKHLSLSWMWKSEPGVASLVTIQFLPQGDRTLMQFEHAHVGYDSAHNYLQGWNDTFLKLEKALTP